MAACNTAIYEIPPGEDWNPDSDPSNKGTTPPTFDAAPGSVEKLPVGWKKSVLNWGHPNPAYPAYQMELNRDIAIGLGVSYQALSGDLSQASYSSMRQGALDERENYIAIQEWLIQQAHTRIFAEWLKMALTTQAIPLPIEKFEKFNKPLFQGRRWLWVDPSADIDAAEKAVRQGWTTNQAVCSTMGGGSFTENMSTLEAENKAKTKAGLQVDPNQPRPAAPVQEKADGNKTKA